MKKGIWTLALVAMVAAFSFGQAQEGLQNGAQAGQLPPEQAGGTAQLIMGYDVAPGAGQDISNYPTNTSLGYKGVIAGDFDHHADVNDELMVDFGASGVWYYNGGNWSQLSGLNPQGMISVHHAGTPDDEALFDFGSTGLWWWDGGWTQLSGANAEGMFALDDDMDGDDEIQVDFGTLGIWRYDPNDLSWKQFTGLNPEHGWMTDYGQLGLQEGTWNFPTAGMWSLYSYSTGLLYYYQHTGTYTAEDDFATANFVSSSGAKDFVADFASLGLWLRTGSAWYQISTMSANRIKEVKFVGGQDYELLAEDNIGGLYWGNWNGSTFTWTLITNDLIGPGSAWCETFDEDGTDSGDEEVIIPMSGGGAKKYDYSAGPALTTWISDTPAWYISFMVKGDCYGRGYDSTLVVVFNSSSAAGAPGLWLYDKQSTWGASWVKISGLVPDGNF